MTRIQNDHPVALARARVADGPITMRALAAKASLSVRVVQRVEAGHTVREDTLQAIADAVGVNFAQLTQDVADWQRKNKQQPTEHADRLAA
jgi:transcriptional regulator with XRE-family HTH domain